MRLKVHIYIYVHLCTSADVYVYVYVYTNTFDIKGLMVFGLGVFGEYQYNVLVFPVWPLYHIPQTCLNMILVSVEASVLLVGYWAALGVWALCFSLAAVRLQSLGALGCWVSMAAQDLMAHSLLGFRAWCRLETLTLRGLQVCNVPTLGLTVIATLGHVEPRG